MDVLYEKLLEIREKYWHYIREKSLIHLDIFTNGYVVRQREIHPDYKPMIRFFPDFQQYVEQYYQRFQTPYGWFDIIEQNSANTAEAFDKFYEILEQFIDDKGLSRE